MIPEHLYNVAIFLQKDGNVEEITKTKKPGSEMSNSLLIHRIPPKICKKVDLFNLFLDTCYVKAKEIDDIAFGSSTGKTHTHFSSNKHASLAFESLKGTINKDKTGKEQKKVYMKNGDYIQ